MIPAEEITKVIPEDTHEETRRLSINPDLAIVPKSGSDSDTTPNPLSHNDSATDHTSDSPSMSKSGTDSSDEALATPKFDVDGFLSAPAKSCRIAPTR